jgi:hypothetical protein
MFKNIPLILSHESSCDYGHFVTNDYIIFKDKEENYSLKDRACPHRAYLMHKPGDVVKQVECKLHGFCWDDEGKPANEEHFYKLAHKGEVTKGKSGLLFQNFTEPQDAEWVNTIGSEKNLRYTKSYTGHSNGSWLWLMDVNADLVHFRRNGVHPRQSLETPLDSLELLQGDSWCQQVSKSGFWLFVFPFHQIDYEPGKLGITRNIPDNINNEFGFSWHTQIFYDDRIDSKNREIFEEQLVQVYLEDVEVVENTKRPFFPLRKGVNKWENHTLHWTDWYLKNKIKSNNE